MIASEGYIHTYSLSLKEFRKVLYTSFFSVRNEENILDENIYNFLLDILKNEDNWENNVSLKNELIEKKILGEISALEIESTFIVKSSQQSTVNKEFSLVNYYSLGGVTETYGMSKLAISYKTLDHKIKISIPPLSSRLRIDINDNYGNYWYCIQTWDTRFFIFRSNSGNTFGVANVNEVLIAIKNEEFDKIVKCDFQSFESRNDSPQK